MERVLEITDRVVGLALLRGDHAEIVPGFRIIGAQLDGLLEILAAFGEGVFAEVERTEVVVRLRLIRFRCDDLLEGCDGLIKIAALEERDSVGEIVALKGVFFVERSCEGKRLARSFRGRLRKGCDVFKKAFGCDDALEERDDPSFGVYEEGGWQGEVATAIKEVAIKNVVDADDFRCGEQSREGEIFSRNQRAGRPCVIGLIYIDSDDAQAALAEGFVILL